MTVPTARMTMSAMAMVTPLRAQTPLGVFLLLRPFLRSALAVDI